MLSIALSLTREVTGWLRQHPELLQRVRPIPGLVSEDENAAAKCDWHASCDAFHKHARNRVKEIQRVMRAPRPVRTDHVYPEGAKSARRVSQDH